MPDQISTNAPDHTSHETRSGLLKKSAAVAFIGVSTRSFERHVMPFVTRVRVGGLYLYPIEELRAWLDRNAVGPRRVETARSRGRSPAPGGQEA